MLLLYMLSASPKASFVLFNFIMGTRSEKNDINEALGLKTANKDHTKITISIAEKKLFLQIARGTYIIYVNNWPPSNHLGIWIILGFNFLINLTLFSRMVHFMFHDLASVKQSQFRAQVIE